MMQPSISLDCPLTQVGKTILLLMVLAGLLSPGHADSREYILIDSAAIAIWGDKAYLKEARYLEEVFAEVKGELEGAIDWELQARPNVLLVGGKESFELMSGSPLVTAYAVPSRHFIAIRLSTAGSRPQILRETFSHELCHLLLHENIRGDIFPRWLDEGVCQWVSGSLGEILAGEGFDTIGIDTAAHSIPLRKLHGDFPGDKNGLLLAYAQSRSVVEFLSKRYGKEGIRGILNRLKAGNSIDEAMPGALGASFDQIEEEWLENLPSTRFWFIWATRHLYDVLFFATAILTVLAFIRLWARKKRTFGISDAEEEDTLR